MLTLTPLQLKYLEATDWLVSNQLRSGRTTLLAYSLIRAALSHPGKWHFMVDVVSRSAVPASFLVLRDLLENHGLLPFCTLRTAEDGFCVKSNIPEVTLLSARSAFGLDTRPFLAQPSNIDTLTTPKYAVFLTSPMGQGPELVMPSGLERTDVILLGNLVSVEAPWVTGDTYNTNFSNPNWRLNFSLNPAVDSEKLLLDSAAKLSQKTGRPAGYFGLAVVLNPDSENDCKAVQLEDCNIHSSRITLEGKDSVKSLTGTCERAYPITVRRQ